MTNIFNFGKKESNKIRCSVCGRFIAYKDLEEDRASFIMILPDSDLSVETWEGLCKNHYESGGAN